MIGGRQIRKTRDQGIEHPIVEQLERSLHPHHVGAAQHPAIQRWVRQQGRHPIGDFEAKRAHAPPAGLLVNLALQPQQTGVTDQLPLTLAALHPQIAEFKAAFAVAAGGGFTEAVALSHLGRRAQPQQSVEGFEHTQLKQAARA